MTLDNRWLSKYKKNISGDVLELGMGLGRDTVSLIKLCSSITASDKKIKNNVKIYFSKYTNITLLELNHEFDLYKITKCFNVIISSLSLHYFCKKTTDRLFETLTKMLVKDGYLILRLNSTIDYNFGASKRKNKREFSYNRVTKKSYFSKSYIKELSHKNELKIIHLKQRYIDRYQKRKNIIEVLLKK